MADTALEELASTHLFSLAKAVDNLSLSQNFMALLARTIWESYRNGKDVLKVKIGSPWISGNELRAKLEYGVDSHVQDIPMLGRVEGLEEFMGKKSAQFVKVLQRNPTYKVFFARAVEMLETYALQKGKKFSELEVIKGIIDSENVMVMTLI